MKYLVKKSNPIQNHSCFLKKMGKNGTQISNGYSRLINVCTTLILVSD